MAHVIRYQHSRQQLYRDLEHAVRLGKQEASLINRSPCHQDSIYGNLIKPERLAERDVTIRCDSIPNGRSRNNDPLNQFRPYQGLEKRV